MSIDRRARADLRNALINYLIGAIRTFEFDDHNWPCFKSSDRSLQEVARVLYSIHDDIIDHPICVSNYAWEALRRVVAFLATDLEIQAAKRDPSWPFHDEKEWQNHGHFVNELGLPDYDPEIHYRPFQPWWNWIPTWIGFLIIAGAAISIWIVMSLLIHRR